MHANSDTETVIHICVLHDDKICFTLTNVVFYDHSKLKGQCSDVKNGCGPSVGPSLTPTESVKTIFSCYSPFKEEEADGQVKSVKARVRGL